MRFSAAITVLAILVAACGPKPEFRVFTDGTPKAIWDKCLSRLPDNDSIAIRGKIKLKSSKTYDFGFEAFYINVDTLNLTAHGPLGTGWVRVLLLGDSVYLTNSKNKTPVLYNKNDPIYLDDNGNRVDISVILMSLFLRPLPQRFNRVEYQDDLISYRYENQTDTIETFIDSDNCLPVKQRIRADDDCYLTRYFSWKMVNKNQFYPTKIVMESSSSSGIMQFQIKNIKTSAKLPRDLFFHKIKG